MGEAPDFFVPWVEAGEADVMGNAPTGLDDLLMSVTLIDVNGMMQPPEGDWVKATAIIEHVDPRIFDRAFAVNKRPSAQELTGCLRRNRDP